MVFEKCSFLEVLCEPSRCPAFKQCTKRLENPAPSFGEVMDAKLFLSKRDKQSSPSVFLAILR